MRRTTAATIVAVAAAAWALAPWAGPGAQAQATGVSLEVEVGHDGRFAAGAHTVPVRIGVGAQRRVDGELRIGSGGDTTRVVPVEITGGTTKDIVAVLDAEDAAGTVKVELREGGDTTAEASGEGTPVTDEELVGLLEGITQGRPAPGPTALRVDAGVARFVTVDDALLDTPGGLGGLTVLAATTGDLEARGDNLGAVLRWVASGGSLYLDAPPGTPVAGLPKAWQPGADGRALAGLGEVRAVGPALRAGDFAGLIEPTAGAVADRSEDLGQFDELRFRMASDAGLRVPRIGWLAAFLLLYVVVAIPVTQTVLRRKGRGELGWVALPVIAVVFTTGAVAAGGDLRGDANGTTLTIVELAPGAAGRPGPGWATTSAGVVARGGGRETITAPAGWVAGHRTLAGRGNDVTVVATADATAATLKLGPGEFSGLQLSGPIPMVGGIEVDGAPSDATHVEGTVRNGIGSSLDGVVVVVDGHATRVSGLGPGDAARWRVETGPSGGDVGHVLGDGWFSQAMDEDLADVTTAATQYLSQRARALAPGTAIAIGWARDAPGPVTLPAASAPGATIYVQAWPLTARAGTTSGLATRRNIVRTGDNGVARFTIPAAPTGATGLRLTGMFAERPEVWVDGAWRPIAGRLKKADGVAAQLLPGNVQIPEEMRQELLDQFGGDIPPEVLKGFAGNGDLGWSSDGGGVVFGPDGPITAGGPISTFTLPPGAVLDGVVWVRTSSVYARGDTGGSPLRLEVRS